MQLLALVETKERKGILLQDKERSSDSWLSGTIGDLQSNNAWLVSTKVKVITDSLPLFSR